MIILALLLAQSGVATCRTVDGDTLKCIDLNTQRTIRVRLNGIDAPETHCRESYTKRCPSTSTQGRYSSSSLSRMTNGRPVYYDGLDIDRYRRLVAQVKVNGSDLSCEQVRKGYAAYKRKWDEQRRLWHSCPYVRRNYRYNGDPAK